MGFYGVTMAKLTQNEITILISQLEERYKAMHIIRERAQSVSLWTLGLFATGAGWLVQSKISLDYSEKITISIIILVIYLVLRLYYLKDLRSGFIGQQKVAARIENTLGLFRKGRFCTESILPSTWQNAGEKSCEGNFFNTTFVIIGISVVILLFGIFFQGKL